MPTPVNALALGQLDDSYEYDLAIAAGTELMIVYGRDRRLSQDENRQAEVADPVIDRFSFEFSLASLAIGDFIWDRAHRAAVAVLSDDGRVQVLERPDERREERAKGPTSSMDQWQFASSVSVLSSPPLPHVSSPPTSPVGRPTS